MSWPASNSSRILSTRGFTSGTARAVKKKPKMKPYIYNRRNLIHIIDVRETLKCVIAAKRFLSRIIAGGQGCGLVGTKRQARSVIEKSASAPACLRSPTVARRHADETTGRFRSPVAAFEELEHPRLAGRVKTYSKKMEASLKREFRKKFAATSRASATWTAVPGAVFVVDVKREIIAIKEARKLGIPWWRS